MDKVKLYEYAMQHISDELIAFAENEKYAVSDNSKYDGFSYVVDAEKLIRKIEDTFDFLNYKER